MENKIKLIVFDFDGVLADSFRSIYPLIRDAMASVGLSLTPAQYRIFFTGNVHQGFKNFISDEKKHKLFLEFRKNNHDNYYHPKLFGGAVELLNKLKGKKLKSKFRLAIASAGKRGAIINLLRKHKIDQLFDKVLGTNKTKEEMLKEIMEGLGNTPAETALITDTAGDIKAAKNFNLKTIAVSWGFHSEKTLKSERPDYLANNFKVLYKNIIAS